MGKGKYQKVFYGIAAIALIVIGFNAFSSKPAPKTDIINKQSQVSSNPVTPAVTVSKSEDNQKQPTPDNKVTPGNETNDKTNVTKTTPITDNTAIKILKSEVSSTAKFYPYKLDGTNMEIIAVKATDGTIRTALNTCQVCYDSGRGYYKQEGAVSYTHLTLPT